MIEMVDEYTKAQIFNNDNIFLGNAMVVGKKRVNEEVALLVEDHVFEELYTDFILRLSNDAYGVITCTARVVDFIRDSDAFRTYEIRCELLEMLNLVQNRENFKIKTSAPAVVTIYENDGTPVFDAEKGAFIRYPVTLKDISASGVLVETQKDFNEGQVFEFTFEHDDPPFIVYAEILRKQEYPDGNKGYGCRFLNLNVAEESSIRRYVFQLQFYRLRGI